MRIIQTLSTAINAASAKVAKDKKLSMILNKDACFYYADALDMTKPVIVEMDKGYSAEQKPAAAPAPKDQKAK
jgi:Skp family chaperone for outer membrane proteins